MTDIYERIEKAALMLKQGLWAMHKDDLAIPYLKDAISDLEGLSSYLRKLKAQAKEAKEAANCPN